MIELEELNRKLVLMKIDFVRPDLGDTEPKRVFILNLLGFEYRIKWWTNIGYLTRDGMVICFDNFVFNNNWPNLVKMNMVFLHEEHVVCRIPCEKYKIQGVINDSNT